MILKIYSSSILGEVRRRMVVTRVVIVA